MDDDLSASVSRYADCVLCLKHNGQNTAGRSHNSSLFRNDGNTLSQYFLTEGRVADLA